jgi:aminopeptidase N
MLEAFIGAAAFRQGLRAYLAQYQYSNAATEARCCPCLLVLSSSLSCQISLPLSRRADPRQDLWAALEAASSQPVGSMMRSWTRQPGYPVLTVREDAAGGMLANQIDREHERYIYIYREQ